MTIPNQVSNSYPQQLYYLGKWFYHRARRSVDNHYLIFDELDFTGVAVKFYWTIGMDEISWTTVRITFQCTQILSLFSISIPPKLPMGRGKVREFPTKKSWIFQIKFRTLLKSKWSILAPDLTYGLDAWVDRLFVNPEAPNFTENLMRIGVTFWINGILSTSNRITSY